MTDAAQIYGGDLQLTPRGDIALVNGAVEGRQRVLRRILTTLGNYIWTPGYGGGVPAMIGQPQDLRRVDGTVRAQMLQEQCVAQIPPPKVVVTAPLPGVTQIAINYQDALTNEGVLLGVTLKP